MADALKKTKRPDETLEIQDVIAISLSGLIVSYGLIGSIRKLTDSFFEKNVKGVVALPKGSLDLEKPIEDRAKNIKHAILEDATYKNSNISRTRLVNNLISSVNAFALAYHGYKRHGQEGQPADIQQYIWAGCWGLAGFYNLTNLGAAYAVGFAKPKGIVVGSQRTEIVDANNRTAQVLQIEQEPIVASESVKPSTPAKKPGRKPKATLVPSNA